MVRKLEVEDIAKILVIADHLEDHLTCTRGEWIQFLISQVDNPKMHIIGDVDENGDIRGYMVLVNNILPPIFDSVVVLFVWTQHGSLCCDRDIIRPLTSSARAWAKEIGAQRGVATIPITHNEQFMNSVGGKLMAHVYEWTIED